MGTPVTLPGAYDMIVEYENATDPDVKWRNTYTFVSSSGPSATSGVAAAIASFAFNMVHADVNYIGWKIYNWARGRQPYPLGTPVLTSSFSSPGNASTVWGSLAPVYVPNGGEVCLRMDHVPNVGGRPGRTFLRALLGKQDVSASSGGRWLLVPSVSALNANLVTILASTGMDPFFGLGSAGDILVVVRYSPKTNVVHGYESLRSFQVIEATTNKLSRKNKR